MPLDISLENPQETYEKVIVLYNYLNVDIFFEIN